MIAITWVKFMLDHHIKIKIGRVLNKIKQMALPTISITSGPVKVTTVYSGDDSNEQSYNDKVTWQPATLLVRDSIYGGATRSTYIQFGNDATYTFLKSVKPLHKTEFENLFGFSPGDFIKGRIIRLLSTYIVRED